MADMMTTTDRAEAIRQTLKTKHGWNSRQVSIRTEYFSMGSSIHITVKDPAVSLATVEQIAEEHENISRCSLTGEILSGGNRYVHVRYTPEALEVLGRRHLEAVERAIESIAPGSSHLVPVVGTAFLVGVPSAGRISVWAEGDWVGERYTAQEAAQLIAVKGQE